MAEPIGDDTYTRGIAEARSALGAQARLRPRVVPPARPVVVPAAPEPDVEPRADAVDPRDARIAALEAEVEALRADIAEARRALDRNR